MKAFFGTVLSLIAAGVMVIAYALMVPHATPFGASAPLMRGFNDPQAMDPYARSADASDRIALEPRAWDDPRAYRPVEYLRDRRVHAVRTDYEPPRRPAVTPTRYRRDWTKTALVIGGSTAGGAGLGGLLGGHKGALIGAALGGSASTLYEALHN